MFYNHIRGNEIKQFRNKLGITQKELGIRMGSRQHSIADWENHKINIKAQVKIDRLCSILNVTEEELFPDYHKQLQLERKEFKNDIQTKEDYIGVLKRKIETLKEELKETKERHEKHIETIKSRYEVKDEIDLKIDKDIADLEFL